MLSPSSFGRSVTHSGTGGCGDSFASRGNEQFVGVRRRRAFHVLIDLIEALLVVVAAKPTGAQGNSHRKLPAYGDCEMMVP